MVNKVFAIYDSKAEAYMVPFFQPTKGQALRMFQDSCNDPKSQLNKHAADFTLFELGEYDDLTGTLTTHGAKINLGNALEFVKVDHRLAVKKAVNSLPGMPNGHLDLEEEARSAL